MNQENSKLKETQELCEYLLNELKVARKSKYDPDKAQQTAAGFLQAQMELSDMLAELELQSDLSEPQIKAVTGKAFVDFKKSKEAKTDAEAKEMAASSKEVADVIEKHFNCKAEFRKIEYLYKNLEKGHYFFKGLAGKN